MNNDQNNRNWTHAFKARRNFVLANRKEKEYENNGEEIF